MSLSDFVNLRIPILPSLSSRHQNEKKGGQLFLSTFKSSM